jgi:hypothetical protein
MPVQAGGVPAAAASPGTTPNPGETIDRGTTTDLGTTAGPGVLAVPGATADPGVLAVPGILAVPGRPGVAERSAGPPLEPALDRVPPGPELAAILSALRLGAASDGTVVDAVAAWERVRCWVEAGQASALTEFASRRPGEADDPGRIGEFAADEVALALHVAPGTAAARIDFAQRLTGLGMTHQALAAGRIGVGVAHRIVDGLTGEDATSAPRLTDPQRRAAEAIVLTDAIGRTPGQVRSRIAHTLATLDPADTAKRHARAVQDRTVRLYPGEDGMATLWARLPADDAVLVMANLRGQADVARTPGDTRTQPQRLADAFVDLHVHQWRTPRPCLCPGCPGNRTSPDPETGPAIGSPAAEAGPAAGGACRCGGPRPRGAARDRSGPRVRVVVAASTLLGLDSRPGHLAGYGPVPAELARRLAADPTGTWQRLLTDPVSGALLDVGRTAYRPPAALDEFVRTRDRTCRFPGCRMPAERCDLDHVRRYPDGPTSKCNLCTECRHHHRLKHDPDWQVCTDPDDPDTLYWTTPAGKTYTTRPRAPLEPT